MKRTLSSFVKTSITLYRAASRGLLTLVLAAPFGRAQVYAYFKGDPVTSIPSADYMAYKTFVRDNAAASAVSGITVIVPWKIYDSGSDALGAALNPLTLPALASDLNSASGGKTINLIILAAGGGIGSGGINTATPSWVFDLNWVTGGCHCSWTTALDVCYCNNYQGTLANGWTQPAVGSNCYNQSNFPSPPLPAYDHSGVPAAWEPPFVTAYNQWLALFLPWAKANLTNLGYIRIGVGTGGGSVIACPNVEEGNFSGQMHKPMTLLSESVWLTYNQSIYSAAALDVSGIMLQASMFGGEIFGGGDGMIPIGWADDEASVAGSNGFGLAAESLSTATDIGDNVLTASASPCSNDWCALFNQYYPTAPILGLQTLSQSDPNCLGEPSSCNLTSSLLTALPFATQHHGEAFEIYYEDLFCAYDSGYTNSKTPSNDGACEMMSAGRQYYSTALTNAAAGQPTSAGSVGGTTKISGTATVQ